MTMKYPWVLFFFILYIPLIWWYLKRNRNATPSLHISTLAPFAKMPRSWKEYLMKGNFLLKLLAMGFMIVALCRPQTYDSHRTSHVEGTDIVLALDISGSMASKDFEPSRFQAAKDVAVKFVNQRSNDNMGLVVFAGESLSLMPLTYDRAALINAIQNVELGDLNDGTAIGDGLASAVNRLVSGKAKSKSIILLTDGTNNAGNVAPATAAQIAKQKGIKVYTIGVGTNGSIQITDPYGFSTTTLETKIDEPALRQIADITGGKFFRAKDEKMLQNVFKEIDTLEKTRLDVENYTRTDEAFFPWVLAALCCYALSMLLRYTVLRRVP
ncbi:MAG: VWA domain-containing protein [Muribaculaceae bacterium]|nr:VWA domain-containing protein [Muribaculaceae bacterium]MDE7343287.1 VWA domain-containing protein [Muribaculaceae bacterium]